MSLLRRRYVPAAGIAGSVPRTSSATRNAMAGAAGRLADNVGEKGGGGAIPTGRSYWCVREGDRQFDRFSLRVDILRNSRTVSRRPSRAREKQTMP